MFGWPNSSPAFDALTLPPYRIRTLVGDRLIVSLGQQAAKVSVDLLGLLGRGHFAGADGPNRLVGDHDALSICSAVTPASEPSNCVLMTCGRLAGFALFEQLADAHDRHQAGGERRVRLLVHVGVGLVEDVPPLAVAEDDVLRARRRAASPALISPVNAPLASWYMFWPPTATPRAL